MWRFNAFADSKGGNILLNTSCACIAATLYIKKNFTTNLMERHCSTSDEMRFPTYDCVTMKKKSWDMDLLWIDIDVIASFYTPFRRISCVKTSFINLVVLYSTTYGCWKSYEISIMEVTLSLLFTWFNAFKHALKRNSQLKFWKVFNVKQI